MGEKFNLNVIESTFEEKVYIIADEVLRILKELYRENKKQIDSRMIADKMIWRDSLRNILNEIKEKKPGTENKQEFEILKRWTEYFLERLSDIIPESELKKLNELRDQLKDLKSMKDTPHIIESPIKVIKRYISLLSIRNRELESFVKQIIQYLSDTEKRISGEIETNANKIDSEKVFLDDLNNNLNMIVEDINNMDDVNRIKLLVIKKIEDINRRIDKKREEEMKRLQETEKNLREMSNRMKEIMHEAEEIKRRSMKLEFEITRDNLTGLNNRRAYNEKITEILAHVRRYGINASLMVCDIDHFKKINDTYGHKVGDLALKKLATLLKERMRVNDFIARYGGEEFVVILPHTDIEGATSAAESLRSYIDRSIFTYNGMEIPLTVSIGVSQFRPDDNHESVFERADHALYLAKRSGRNTVKTEKDLELEGSTLTLMM